VKTNQILERLGRTTTDLMINKMAVQVPRKRRRVDNPPNFICESREQPRFMNGVHTTAAAAAVDERYKCPCHQQGYCHQRPRRSSRISGPRPFVLLLLLFMASRQGNADNHNRNTLRGLAEETRITVFEWGNATTNSSTNDISKTINNDDGKNNAQRSLVFAVVPMTTDNPYFELIKQGCMDQATRMTGQLNHTTISCECVGPTSQDADQDRAQVDWVLNLLKNDTIAGIAISVRNEALLQPVLENANITKPIVTFDSDLAMAPHLRWAYIGTNNTFLGMELARIMLQLHPRIGTYAILQSGTAPNMMERREGFVNELNARKPGWKAWEASPEDAKDNVSRALLLLDGFARRDPDCIVSLMGLPMRIVVNETTGTESIPWQQMYNEHVDRNITWLCVDAMPHQLELMGSGYVQALIGQMPLDMGRKSIEILYNIQKTGNIEGVMLADGTPTSEGVFVTHSSGHLQGDVVTSIKSGSSAVGDAEDPTYVATNVLSHIFVPLQLPEIDVDHNLIGDLRYVGYTCFAVIMFTAAVLLHWTINLRKVRVVQVAQPKFLGMVLAGVAIMGFALLPLSMDDGGNPDNLTDLQALWMCMSVPWLVSIGFTTAFSALYAKTRYVERCLVHMEEAVALIFFWANVFTLFRRH
jgi:ABC-type sugar transport system substrate-binding protein